jgi:hypothetical protein
MTCKKSAKGKEWGRRTDEEPMEFVKQMKSGVKNSPVGQFGQNK